MPRSKELFFFRALQEFHHLNHRLIQRNRVPTRHLVKYIPLLEHSHTPLLMVHRLTHLLVVNPTHLLVVSSIHLLLVNHIHLLEVNHTHLLEDPLTHLLLVSLTHHKVHRLVPLHLIPPNLVFKSSMDSKLWLLKTW